MSSKIRSLETAVSATLHAALEARKKLSAARSAEDEVDVRAFLTLDEHRTVVRKIYREHQKEMQKTILQLVTPVPYRATAADIIRAGKKRRGELED